MATRRNHAEGQKTGSISIIEEPSNRIEVELRISISHLPASITLTRADSGEKVIDLKPEGNDIDQTVTLPADQINEFLIDIRWPQKGDTVFFAMITVRRDGMEDVDTVFKTYDHVFSSTLTIDTRPK